MSDDTVDTVPCQVGRHRSGGKLPRDVHMMAYEVYAHVYGKQEALIENGCRGGFSAGELIAFLYARNFPKQEWSARVRQTFARFEEAK